MTSTVQQSGKKFIVKIKNMIIITVTILALKTKQQVQHCEEVARSLLAVSYTHLDVYKRQK